VNALTAAVALNWRALCARAYVRVVGTFRSPEHVLADALFPNLGMVAFVMLYRALGAPKVYESMAVIGGVLTTYWLNVLWGMGAQFYWEKQQGQLQLYFAAPCSIMAILGGMALGGLGSTVVRSTVGVLMAIFVFHIGLTRFSWTDLAMVFFVTMLALYALGMTLSSLFLLYGREAWHTCNALTEPVYFLSGLYFPVRILGMLGSVAAAILPLSLGLDALRQVLLGAAAQGLLPVRTELAALAVLAVVFLVVSRFALQRLEHMAKQEGKLTQRWQ